LNWLNLGAMGQDELLVTIDKAGNGPW